MNKYVRGYEPVRVIGWVTTVLVFAGAVIKQVADTYDEGTGWLGLAFAVTIALSTELQRRKVTPVRKIIGAAGANVPTSPGYKFENG